jgi:hypothetical protein
MNRLELMLEKLLEVSIANAQATQQASSMPTTGVFTELAKLRSEIEEQRQREGETVTELRKEIELLKKNQGRRHRAGPEQVSPTIDTLPDILQKSAENGSKKASETARKISKQMSKMFQRNERSASELHSADEGSSSIRASTSTQPSVPQPTFLDGDVTSQLDEEEEAERLEDIEELSDEYLVDTSSPILQDRREISTEIEQPSLVRDVSELTTPELHR